jgi:hypothetical protein
MGGVRRLLDCNPSCLYYFPASPHRAISSVVERLLHTQEVAGSNPASRTIFRLVLRSWAYPAGTRGDAVINDTLILFYRAHAEYQNVLIVLPFIWTKNSMPLELRKAARCLEHKKRDDEIAANGPLGQAWKT